MGCSGKQKLTEYGFEDLRSLKVSAPDEEVRKKVKEIWDDIAKPLDGLGDFEELFCRIGAIKGSTDLCLSKKALVIMCSDNGIVREGVSQSDSSVTLSVLKNMVRGRSSVAVMAEKNGIDVFVYDVGVDSDDIPKGCIDRKIGHGTKDFYIEPAMSREETIKAINVGIGAVKECKDNGYDMILTGEMGIGNTTTSSAVSASLLGRIKELGKDKKGNELKEISNIDLLAEKITGRGAGLDDKKLENKKRIIKEAIKKYSLLNADPLTVLSSVGGFDIAALTGVCIGGALFDIPIILDGVITLTAALTAEELFPGVKDYLILSHKGKEPASEMIAERLQMKAVIDADMALGEGTGAVMMMSLLEDALSVYKNASRFSEIEVENYLRN